MEGFILKVINYSEQGVGFQLFTCMCPFNVYETFTSDRTKLSFTA